jgi:hypothetical protein
MMCCEARVQIRSPTTGVVCACVRRRKPTDDDNGRCWGVLACDTMKWLTLKSSLSRSIGRSDSIEPSDHLVPGGPPHGLNRPLRSLQTISTSSNRPDSAHDATDADQMTTSGDVR